MTPQEAIQRIKQHNEIHSKKERFAIYITEALNMAVETLEKQIPKKPHRRKDTTYTFCPCCDSGNLMNDYCTDCGQKIDWSGTE